MNPTLLYASPFRGIAPSGPEQVFSIERTHQFVQAVERLNSSASGWLLCSVYAESSPKGIWPLG